MRRLFSVFTATLFAIAAGARAAVVGEAGPATSDSEVMAWALVIIFAFFSAVGYYTWLLIKAERKRQLESKPPE